MSDPILITGAARSGTSMVAGIVDTCGSFGGDITGPTPYNQKGQFENTYIRQNIVKPYLRLLGVDPLGQSPLPDINNLIPWPNLAQDVRSTFKREGYRGKAPFYYKGAKMCLLWPLWHKAFPQAKWIIVRRKPEDIVASCMRTPFMRAYKSMVGWMQWVLEHEKRFEEMKNAGLDITEVWSSDLIEGDFSMIAGFVNQVDGLQWNESDVREFVTPSLWKGGNK